MGEHNTWFELLPGWVQITKFASKYLGKAPGQYFHFMAVGPFQDTHFTLVHVVVTLLLLCLIAMAALRFRASLRKGEKDEVIPPKKLGVRFIFEGLVEWVLGFMTNIMGEDNAKKYLPLIVGLAVFILGSNLIALIPGFEPPTATLKTNLALALTVFVITHYEGVKTQGIKKYLQHFMGPISWLAPLMFVIELISHIARPVSLSLRLMGNIFADHKVVFIFCGLVPIVVPLPFLLLGTLVAVVQTFVFCLLATTYIQMAVAHTDHNEHTEHTEEGAADQPLKFITVEGVY